MDILGFKGEVKKASSDELLLDKLYNAIKHIRDERSANQNYASNINDFQFSFVSDSIIISAPSENDNCLYFAFVMAEYMIIELSYYGLMVRGGISVGDMIHEDDIAFGPALNDAVNLEQNIAIYPRVIFSDETFNKIDNMLKDKDAYSYPYDIIDFKKLIKTYKNEINETWHYLDFVSQRQFFDDNEEYAKFMNNIKEFIYSRKKEFKDNKHILDKYIWLENYCNNVK